MGSEGQSPTRSDPSRQPIIDSKFQVMDQISKGTLGEDVKAKAPPGCAESPTHTCTQAVSGHARSQTYCPPNLK